MLCVCTRVCACLRVRVRAARRYGDSSRRACETRFVHGYFSSRADLYAGNRENRADLGIRGADYVVGRVTNPRGKRVSPGNDRRPRGRDRRRRRRGGRSLEKKSYIKSRGPNVYRYNRLSSRQRPTAATAVAVTTAKSNSAKKQTSYEPNVRVFSIPNNTMKPCQVSLMIFLILIIIIIFFIFFVSSVLNRRRVNLERISVHLQILAALSVMTACAVAIPIFVDGGPRGQASESSESYVSSIHVAHARKYKYGRRKRGFFFFFGRLISFFIRSVHASSRYHDNILRPVVSDDYVQFSACKNRYHPFVLRFELFVRSAAYTWPEGVPRGFTDLTIST